MLLYIIFLLLVEFGSIDLEFKLPFLRLRLKKEKSKKQKMRS